MNPYKHFRLFQNHVFVIHVVTDIAQIGYIPVFKVIVQMVQRSIFLLPLADYDAVKISGQCVDAKED